MMAQKIIDLEGRTFNKWRVLSFSHQDTKSRNAYWHVECSCGGKAVVKGSSLINQVSMQCKRCACKANGRVGLYSKGQEGDLYMIRVGAFVKIGVSTDVQRRLKDIESTCPYDAELVYFGKGEAGDEKLWHDIFKHRHHRGEWFHMPAGLCELPNT